MIEWIKISDKLPQENETVFYYFDYLGVYAGIYNCVEDEHLGKMNCFSGKGGYLCDDVTHWMPRKENDFELPEKPDMTIEDFDDVLNDVELCYNHYIENANEFLNELKESKLSFDEQANIYDKFSKKFPNFVISNWQKQVLIYLELCDILLYDIKKKFINTIKKKIKRV